MILPPSAKGLLFIALDCPSAVSQNCAVPDSMNHVESGSTQLKLYKKNKKAQMEWDYVSRISVLAFDAECKSDDAMRCGSL